MDPRGAHRSKRVARLTVRTTYIVPTEVGLEFSCKDLESSTFADTVGTDETEYLTGTRGR